MSFLSFRVMFHFHDYGKKGNFRFFSLLQNTSFSHRNWQCDNVDQIGYPETIVQYVSIVGFLFFWFVQCSFQECQQKIRLMFFMFLIVSSMKSALICIFPQQIQAFRKAFRFGQSVTFPRCFVAQNAPATWNLGGFSYSEPGFSCSKPTC